MKIKKMAKIFPGFLLLFMFFAPNLAAQGHFEFGFHYSRWSIDILGNIIEDLISDGIETRLKDKILEDIQETHPDLQERSYSQELEFDSSGDNYGFEIRWYPGGENGSFSLGLSVEKTAMEVSLPKVAANLELTDDSSFQGEADGKIAIHPLSFHLSFRWDIKPSWRVHPYMTFGVGAAAISSFEEDELEYSYSGLLTRPGEDPDSFTGGRKDTIKKVREEYKEEEGEDLFPINFLPFIQLNLGLKGELMPNLHLLLDAGVWDGFLIRGGIALRF